MGRCKVDGDDWRAELLVQEEASRATSGKIAVINKVESNTLIVSLKPSST
jgi:membrane protein implicated in regulation of membrane protease activity